MSDDNDRAKVYIDAFLLDPLEGLDGVTSLPEDTGGEFINRFFEDLALSSFGVEAPVSMMRMAPVTADRSFAKSSKTATIRKNEHGWTEELDEAGHVFRAYAPGVNPSAFERL